MNVAEKLKEICDGRGTKYSFVAEKVGMPVDMVCRIFAGKRKLSADEMLSFCRVLEVTPNDLMLAVTEGGE